MLYRLRTKPMGQAAFQQRLRQSEELHRKLHLEAGEVVERVLVLRGAAFMDGTAWRIEALRDTFKLGSPGVYAVAEDTLMLYVGKTRNSLYDRWCVQSHDVISLTEARPRPLMLANEDTVLFYCCANRRIATRLETEMNRWFAPRFEGYNG